MFHPADPTRRPRALTTALIVVAVVLGGIGTSVAASYAVAGAPVIDVPETGAPGLLVLSSAAFESDMGAIAPGVPVFWQVDARLTGQARATLALHVQARGELAERADGLRVQISECDSAWVASGSSPVCAGGPRIRLPVTTAQQLTASDPTVTLSDLVGTGRNHLLIELGVEDSASSRADATLMGATGSIGLRLTAVGVDVTVEPTPTPTASPVPSASPDPTPTDPGTPGPGGGSGSGGGVEGTSTEAERLAQLRRDAAAQAAAQAARDRADARARVLAATGGTILVPLLFGSAILLAGLVLTLRFGRSTAAADTAGATVDDDSGTIDTDGGTVDTDGVADAGAADFDGRDTDTDTDTDGGGTNKAVGGTIGDDGGTTDGGAAVAADSNAIDDDRVVRVSTDRDAVEPPDTESAAVDRPGGGSTP